MYLLTLRTDISPNIAKLVNCLRVIRLDLEVASVKAEMMKSCAPSSDLESANNYSQGLGGRMVIYWAVNLGVHSYPPNWFKTILVENFSIAQLWGAEKAFWLDVASHVTSFDQ